MSIYKKFKMQAYQNIDNMKLELARMERVYRKYKEHGAVMAAEVLKDEIDALRAVIEFDEYLMAVAFIKRRNYKDENLCCIWQQHEYFANENQMP